VDADVKAFKTPLFYSSSPPSYVNKMKAPVSIEVYGVVIVRNILEGRRNNSRGDGSVGQVSVVSVYSRG
jgi:hypothetical protein